MSQHNTMVPAVLSSESRAGYDAARRGVAIVARIGRGLIVVSGADRGSYLHGLFTNDISRLKAGEGTYTAYLTPQGRMIADLWVYELGDVMLLALTREVVETVMAKLDQFIFTEDVQLGDVTDTYTAISVVGPRAESAVAGVLDSVSVEALGALQEHGNLRARFNGQPAIVVRVTDIGAPGFDVMVDAAQAAALRAAVASQGAVEADDATAEALRIEAGVPKFHRDMDEETIPLEAGIEGRAISMTKGCYVGQEVIIRVLHRGHGRVARKLVGLTMERGSTTQPGAIVTADAREIGKVTSVTASPALDRTIALAYVHRDFVTPDTRVTVEHAPALVTALPFVSPD